MKRILALATVITTLAICNPAPAQTLNLDISPNDPVTGLPPAKWLLLVGKMIHAEALVGLPQVLFINATPEAMTVTCSKWQIVGTQPYKSVAGNPAELKPFSITPVRTNEFDGYCKEGVVGHTQSGDTIRGRLNDADGSFSNATVVVFAAK
jgi:hypothetical protein